MLRYYTKVEITNNKVNLIGTINEIFDIVSDESKIIKYTLSDLVIKDNVSRYGYSLLRKF